MRTTCIAIFLFGIVASAVAAPVRATHAEIELVCDVRSIQPGKPFTAAVRLKLDPGWHTYWANPGDAGVPVRIEWDLPPGFKVDPVQWPTPRLFRTSPLASFGYEGEVYLLTQITPPESPADRRITLKAEALWLVCKRVCLPATASLSLALPVRSRRPRSSRAAAAIAKAREALPEPGAGWFCQAFHRENEVALHGKVPEGELADISQAFFFPEDPNVIKHAADQEWEVEGNVFRLTMQKGDDEEVLPRRIKGVLELGEERAIQIDCELVAGKPHVFQKRPAPQLRMNYIPSQAK